MFKSQNNKSHVLILNANIKNRKKKCVFIYSRLSYSSISTPISWNLIQKPSGGLGWLVPFPESGILYIDWRLRWTDSEELFFPFYLKSLKLLQIKAIQFFSTVLSNFNKSQSCWYLFLFLENCGSNVEFHLMTSQDLSLHDQIVQRVFFVKI